MEAVAQAILHLSVDERLRLLEVVWASLVDDVDQRVELPPAIAAELDRRLAEHRRNADDVLTLAQFESEARRRR